MDSSVFDNTSKRKRNRGQKIGMKIVTDITYERMLMLKVSNKESIDCCGNRISFTKITHGFVFVPGMKRVCEMLQDKSGYNFIPGTAVCLTTSKRKRNSGEKKAMKIVTDTTNERMLVLNVYNREKSEYVKTWEQLMEKFKKQTK